MKEMTHIVTDAFSGAQFENLTTTSLFNIGNVSTDTAITKAERVDELANEVIKSVVVVIAMVGTVANGFVLYVVYHVSKSSKSNAILVVHQLVCDLFASVFVVITFAWKLAGPKLRGTMNRVFCLLIGSEAIMWVGVNASVFNLVFIAIERYILTRFSLWHRNHYKPWFSYCIVVFIWIDGVVTNVPTTYVSTDFSDYKCNPFLMWPTKAGGQAFISYYILSVYVLPLIIFIFCYSNIILVVKRNSKIHSSSNPKGSTNDSQDKNQMNIMKTMMIITLTFTILWLPSELYFIMLNIDCCGFSILTTEWNLFLLFGFLTSCINPFIYGVKTGNFKSFIKTFKK